MYVLWATCFTFTDTNDWVFTRPAIWDHLYHTVQWKYSWVASTSFTLILPNSYRVLWCRPMRGVAAFRACRPRRAAPWRVWRAPCPPLRAPLVCVRVHMCVFLCARMCVCVHHACQCWSVPGVAVSRGFWDRGRGELQRMGDDIFHFCKPFSLPKYQLQHETHALLKPVCKLTRTKTTPSSWLSANCHPTSQKFCLACVTFLPPLPRGRQCPSGDSSAGECCSEIGARDLEAEVQEPDRGESPAASG